MKKLLNILLTGTLMIVCISVRSIDPPELIRVTIDTGTQNVNLYWTAASPTSGVTYYEIRKWVFTGYTMSGIFVSRVNVPSVHYAYYDPDVFNKPVGFYIRALTDSVHTSSPSNIDSTIYLESDFDSCSASIHLRWNDYNTWRGHILRYEIFESVNNDPYHLCNTFTEGTNQTTIYANADRIYQYYVLAIRRNARGDSSISNLVSVNTKMSVIPAKIEADYCTIVSNQPFLRFSIDTASELINYVLLRSNTASGPFDSLVSLQTTDKTIEFHDPVDASVQPYYYRLKALNYCGQDARVSENTASSIFLQVKNERVAPALNWTAYENWIEGVASYRIQRILNDENYEEIASVNGLSYTDNSFASLAGNNVSNKVCYRIVAMEESGSQNSSTSNEICVNLPINVRFEFNAFQPGSTNNGSFGPTLDFIPDYFVFEIFNRWGSKVFESHDPSNPRWNGNYSGRFVPEGVYRYQLEYKNENGKKVLLHGDVTVVNP